MSCRRSKGIGRMLALGCALAMMGGAERAQGQDNHTSTVVRTLVYHEITAFPRQLANMDAVLSADGSRAVFTEAPGPEQVRTSHIFVINTDGTGLREVDAYPQLCNCSALLDISADGSRVISTDGVQLRIANADGSGARSLIEGPEIRYLRISGDGSRVFFQVRRDSTLRGTSTPVQRGLWVIHADGSGLRQVVGPNQIAALLGIPADNVFPFDTNGWSLDVSADGSRIVFGARAAGERIFAINLDGTGLHELLGPVDFVNHAGISSNGEKVLYDIVPPPCCSTPNEAGVMNFDGTGRRALASPSRSLPFGFAGSQERMQLSADGSKLLLGSTGVLFDTATGTPLQLAARGAFFSSDPPLLAYDGMFRATMNSSATRFLYLVEDAKGVRQLATLDLNPAGLGDAPSITDATIDPAFVVREGRTTATVRAEVSTSHPFLRVSSVVLRGGLNDDPNMRAQVLLDDGSGGDAKAGDGIFTHNSLFANCCAEAGPRTVRIKAEARAADGRRHATAIDLEPFEVRNP